MATDATGTPTTNFAFPTYLTSADAPSGIGLNNIITDIDTKLLALVKVRKNSVAVGTGRRQLNFIEGTGITLTVTDDSGTPEYDITVATSTTPASIGLILALGG